MLLSERAGRHSPQHALHVGAEIIVVKISSLYNYLEAIYGMHGCIFTLVSYPEPDLDLRKTEADCATNILPSLNTNSYSLPLHPLVSDCD